MFIDLVLLAIFIIVVAVGFFQGTIKLLIAIVTFYASIILASLYFKSLSLLFVRRGTSAVVADAISFFLVLFLCFVILLAMALYTFRYVRFPGRLELLDRLLGVVLGVVLGLVVTSIVAMVLHYAFITHNIGSLYPITRFLANSTRESVTRELLIFNILPRLYVTVAPFLPDVALPFFQPRVG